MRKIYDHSTDVITIGTEFYDKGIVERTMDAKTFCGTEFQTVDEALQSLGRTWKANLEHLSKIYTEGTPAGPSDDQPLLPSGVISGPAPLLPRLYKMTDSLITSIEHSGYLYNNECLDSVTDFEVRRIGNDKVLIRSTPDWDIPADTVAGVRHALEKAMLDDEVVSTVRKQGLARDIVHGLGSAIEKGLLPSKGMQDAEDINVDISSLGFKYRIRRYENNEHTATTAALYTYADKAPGDVQISAKCDDRWEELKSKVTLDSLTMEELTTLRDIVKAPTLSRTVSDKAPDITFIEDQSPYYRERTKRNADESDMTLAIAVDWDTAGEKCTKNCAQKKYVPFRFPENGKEQPNWAFSVQAAINSQGFRPKQDVRLNIAGNGIYTLSLHGISQAQTDAAVLTAVKYLQKTFNITEIRSGGQTGVDEAGIKAAEQLGIPAKVLAPQGWKFRSEAGRDISDEKMFKARFGVTVAEERTQSGTAAVQTKNAEFEKKMKAALAKGTITEAGDLRDGWTRVRVASGRYNFANAEGKLMTRHWFDKATEFENGKATIWRWGSKAVINTSGIAESVTPEVAEYLNSKAKQQHR